MNKDFMYVTGIILIILSVISMGVASYIELTSDYKEEVPCYDERNNLIKNTTCEETLDPNARDLVLVGVILFILGITDYMLVGLMRW